MFKRFDRTRTGDHHTSRVITTAAVTAGALILMLATAAPALAGKPGKASLAETGIGAIVDQIRQNSAVGEEEDDAGRTFDLTLIGPVQMFPLQPEDDETSGPERIRPEGVIPDGGAWEPALPDPLIPDGGDWEPFFPEDDNDDDPADEPEQPVEDQGDEPTQPEEPQQPADDGTDEPGDDEPGDDGTDEPEQPVEDQGDEPTQPEEPEQPADEQPSLAFTGGDNTPYLIAGAAIALFGLMVLRRRRDESERD